ncbi:MAG: heat-inducible transcription repressor HrcA [Clostridia bacterium]|nr:heat-inducible transcription repressor HrcA [Deltaproteobacteria bacterium]
MELDTRKRAVLRHVVEVYIDDAEPVSSSTIARSYGRELAQRRRPETISSATIRNVMAELEAGGYLAQPHSSSGRVPTEKGLKLYLDDLMSPKLRPWDRTRLDEVAATADASSLPTALGQSLAGLSGQVALIALPGLSGAKFREIGLVRMSAGRFVAFFVAPVGIVQQRLVEVDFDLSSDELQRIQNFLNERLVGRSLDEVRTHIASELADAQTAFDSEKKRAFAIGQQAIPSGAPSLVVEGTTRLIEQPEFTDIGRLRSLVHAIEDKSALLGILDKLIAGPHTVRSFADGARDDDSVRVLLASEHHIGDMHEVSLVGRCVVDPSGQQTTVSILGPQRMDYGRLVALVDYASNLLVKYWDQTR